VSLDFVIVFPLTERTFSCCFVGWFSVGFVKLSSHRSAKENFNAVALWVTLPSLSLGRTLFSPAVCCLSARQRWITRTETE